MGTFSAGLANYAKKTGLSIDNAVIAICAKASTSIIKKTPVDTGRAKGNWYATIGLPSTETSETRRANDATMDAKATAKIASGKVFYLTNNLDYIRKLEYGEYPKIVKFGTRLKKMSKKTKKSGVRYEVRTINGYSIQAQKGMVKTTIAEIENKLGAFK